jgi:hypothetical protein
MRDDYYNSVGVLTAGQYTATTQTSGTLAASAMAGAARVFVASSAATALTTDTAANIVAYLQNAVYTQLIASGAVGAGVQGGVPAGVPNLVNLTYLLTILNSDGSTLTLSAGTGVTITGTATMATATSRTYLVTVTSSTSVTLQNVGSGTN